MKAGHGRPQTEAATHRTRQHAHRNVNEDLLVS